MDILSALIPYNTYKILHIVGFITIFMGFAYGMKQWSKGAAIAHGIGLLVVIISGMGMMAGQKFEPWVFIKLAIWLALGGALVVVNRKLVPHLVAWIILLALGAAAAWTVFYGRGIGITM